MDNFNIIRIEQLEEIVIGLPKKRYERGNNWGYIKNSLVCNERRIS